MRYVSAGRGPWQRAACGEDLCRAGHVQALDVVEQRDEHGAGGHTASVRARHDGRNDEYPTFPAIAGRERWEGSGQRLGEGFGAWFAPRTFHPYQPVGNVLA